MAAFDTTRTTYGSSRAAYRIAVFVTEMVDSIIAWNDARVTRKALSTLTDRELDDIGLTRGDIDVVSHSDLIR